MIVLTALQQSEALEKGSAELKSLLARESVSLEIQALFYHFGVVSVARFGSFAKDDEDLRNLLKDDMGLDGTTGLLERSQVAGIIVAYNAASIRTQEFQKHTGELEAKKIQKPLQGSEYLIMKLAFEAIHNKLEDYEAPARVYLEKRIADLEGGDLRAESLQTVLNREQDGDESLVPSWDIAGTVKLRRTVADIADPANPEELRARLAVMFNGLMMVALQHSNRSELQGFTPMFTQAYCQYLLGEHCWLLVAKDADGKVIAAPQWSLVVRYEMAIRKRAYRVMQDSGKALVLCIKESWLDPLTKERAFTTPLAIAAATGHINVEMSSSSSSVAYNHGTAGNNNNVRNIHLKQDKGGGSGGKGRGRGQGKSQKGRGKSNKGKGKGSKSSFSIPSGCQPKTPDGRSVCFGYNDAVVRCRNPECPFVHCCGRCFAKHPIYVCRGNQGAAPSVPAETQGQGVV